MLRMQIIDGTTLWFGCREGLSEEVAFRLRPEGQEESALGRMQKGAFQAEGTARVRAVRWERV